MTIGRAAENTVQILDPTVSRTHARLTLDDQGAPQVFDAGSRYGTFVDGTLAEGEVPLRDGTRIRIGDQDLLVERRRGLHEAGPTRVLRSGTSLVVAPSQAPTIASTSRFGLSPRLRPCALKRLDASEGERRWVLRGLDRSESLRLRDADAALLRHVDGANTLAELVIEAERAYGTAGAGKLAQLLAELADHDLLDSVTQPTGESRKGRLGRLMTPREWRISGIGRLAARLYRLGGWRLFSRSGQAALALPAAIGLGAFVTVVAGGDVTPFVVGDALPLGALVFVLGRLAVVIVHELAHALAMVSCGREVDRAGVKLFLVFPYAWVDTTAAWFEPRARRMLIAAAGPASDLVLGGVFALVSSITHGVARDIGFQLALGAYLGAFLNLNPLLDRDGYQLLVDRLGEPGLRRRAQRHLAARLSGRASGSTSRAVRWYGVLAVGWSLLAAVLAAGFSVRYLPALEQVVALPAVAWAVLVVVWLIMLMPVGIAIGAPLVSRSRKRPQ
jgi:putative peptide zinc metalloprotease protein